MAEEIDTRGDYFSGAKEDFWLEKKRKGERIIFLEQKRIFGLKKKKRGDIIFREQREAGEGRE